MTIRQQLNMTQARFSEVFGFSLDAVKHWERWAADPGSRGPGISDSDCQGSTGRLIRIASGNRIVGTKAALDPRQSDAPNRLGRPAKEASGAGAKASRARSGASFAQSGSGDKIDEAS